jgi:hypothetical protein
MPNKVEVASDLKNLNFIDADSRYINSTILYYSANKRVITFETYKKQKTEAGPNDRFLVITKSSEYRPDKIAHKAYGNSSLWWKIMEANGIMDIMDFSAGRNIVIPDIIF